MEKTTNIGNEESKKKDFEQICKEATVSYKSACKFKSKYKLTDEQAIIYCILTGK